MKLEEIRPNLRIFTEIEHENPAYRSLRGIVISVNKNSFDLLTDFGEIIEISEGVMLNYTNISFPKIVSEVLQELRNYHETIYTLQEEIKENQKEALMVKDQLVDAVFLSKFNVHGARNRLMHSVPKENRIFISKDFSYEITFESNDNKEIEMYVDVATQIDYPQLDESRDLEKIVRRHAPEKSKQIKESFPDSKTVKVVDEGLNHEYESYYNVRRTYCITFDVTRDNFLEFRDSLVKGIELLSR